MLTPEGTLDAKDLLTGDIRRFRLQGSRVLAVEEGREGGELLCGPGFLDLQCNGFAGIDFNHPDTTPEMVVQAIRATWRHGCTAVLPTVVTNSSDRMEHSFRVLEAARELAPETAESVPGYHLEGPFISPVEGARGAHPLSAVTPVDLSLWRRLQKAAGGRIRLVTLAPEVEGALPFISQLRQEGVLPAIGHTMATTAQVRLAADAGALLATHLGNGCPQLLPRHENPVFAQLVETRLTPTLITDGIHLPAHVVTLFVRARQGAPTLIVTDAMAAAGAPPGRYTLGDHVLEVGEDQVVRQPGAPNLAGSALTMDEAVMGMARLGSQTLSFAWQAASLGPWNALRAAAPIPAPSDSYVIARATGESRFQIIATIRGESVLYAAAG